AGTETECSIECLSLRLGQAINAIEEGHEELVQPRESQLDRGFVASDPGDGEADRRLNGVLEEGGLADAGLSAQYEHPAQSGPDRFEQLIDRPALGSAAWQGGERGRALLSMAHEQPKQANSHPLTPRGPPATSATGSGDLHEAAVYQIVRAR